MTVYVSVILPADVVDVLQGIDLDIERAITQLARSYGSALGEAGVESPSVEESTTSHAYQPADWRGKLPHAAPLDPADGLVDWHYILGSNVAIAVEVATSESLLDVEYEIRKQAIRTVLSSLPEDTWNSEETRIAIEALY